MDSSLQNDYCKYIFYLFDVRLVLPGPGGQYQFAVQGGSEFRHSVVYRLSESRWAYRLNIGKQSGK